MNVYYQRAVATERPCYVCRKATKTVLATLNADDFVYTCEGHLSDPGFASPIGPSQDEINKVVAEEKLRAEQKAAKLKAAAEAKAKAAGDEAKDGKDDKDNKKPAKVEEKPASPVASSSPAAASGGSHKKFALHRGILAMRQNEKKRKEQGTQAKAISKGMPQVPRGAF